MVMNVYSEKLVLWSAITYIVLAGLIWYCIKESEVKNLYIFAVTVFGLAVSYSYQAFREHRNLKKKKITTAKPGLIKSFIRFFTSLPELTPDLIGVCLIFNLSIDAWNECAGHYGRYIFFFETVIAAIITIIIYFLKIKLSDLNFQKGE